MRSRCIVPLAVWCCLEIRSCAVVHFCTCLVLPCYTPYAQSNLFSLPTIQLSNQSIIQPPNHSQIHTPVKVVDDVPPRLRNERNQKEFKEQREQTKSGKYSGSSKVV